MSRQAVTQRLHRLKLSNYAFMHDFLTQQWSVTVDEVKNSAKTLNNASIDVVWDSFQCFLESNGYPREFCSKILLGKLLREAGVEKVKRGPRRRQKFYYFPLRPVRGSQAEAIMATKTDARYVVDQNTPRSAFRKQFSRLCSVNCNLTRTLKSCPPTASTRQQQTAKVLEKYDCVQAKVEVQTNNTGNQANSGYNIPEQILAIQGNELVYETTPNEFVMGQNDEFAICNRPQIDSSVEDEMPCDSHTAPAQAKHNDERNRSFSDILVQSLMRLYDTEDNEGSCARENQPPAKLTVSSNHNLPGSACRHTQTAATSSHSPLDKHRGTFVCDGLVPYNTDDSLVSESQVVDVENKSTNTTQEVLVRRSKRCFHHDLKISDNKCVMFDQKALAQSARRHNEGITVFGGI